MLFKDIYYLELWSPFLHLTGIICAILVACILRYNSVKLLNLDLWSGEGDVKRFLMWSSGSPPVQWSITLYTLL